MNLIGKTRDQIERATRNASREEIVDLLYEHATLDPKFTVSQVAKAYHVSRDVILAKINAGEIPRHHVHRSLDNAYRIALSGLLMWDEATALELQKNGA